MSSSTEPRVIVGVIRRAHGVRGDVVVQTLSDHPSRFEPGSRFETEGTPRQTLTVRTVRTTGPDTLLVGFEEITNREMAREVVGSSLTIAGYQRRPLREGEYWPEDLVGLAVVDAGGARLGRVAEVILGQAQDRLVVELNDGSRAEVPFVDQLVPEVDQEARTVTLVPVPGLLS